VGIRLPVTHTKSSNTVRDIIHISGHNYLLKCCGLEKEISYGSTDRKTRQQLLQWTGCPYGCRYQSIPQYVMHLGAVAWGGGGESGCGYGGADPHPEFSQTTVQ
jgi:hypothetical protein